MMTFQTMEWRLVKRKISYGFLPGLKKRLVGGAKRRMTFAQNMAWQDVLDQWSTVQTVIY